MFFRNLEFCIKKHVFLKIMLSLKRNHHFWEVGVDFARPQDQPKSKKIGLEHLHDDIHKKHKKTRVLKTNWNRGPLHFDHPSGRFCCFLKNHDVNTKTNLRKTTREKPTNRWNSGHSGAPKIIKKHDFSKHETHQIYVAGPTDLRGGVIPKPIKIAYKKTQKNETSDTLKKVEN